MGRRRRKTVTRVRRKLPEQYLCPRCGKNTVKSTINIKNEVAVVVCSTCGLKTAFPYQPKMAGVDAYCLFVDNYYGVEKKEATSPV